MSTRTRSAESAVELVRRATTGPFRITITGAQAYWLEDTSGCQLGPESDSTVGPFARALDVVASGTSPDDLVVWARLRNVERYRVAGGALLVDLAVGSAGLPRRPRTRIEPT